MITNKKINFPVMLCILDGFGLSNDTEHNAIYKAHPENISYLLKKYPNTTLQASGEAVGLPKNTMGNSEVGHITIGSGRVIPQFLRRFEIEKEAGNIEKSPILKQFISKIQQNQGIAHVSGLISDGKVHSFIDDALYVVGLLLKNNIRVCIHFIADGRDTSPTSALKFVQKINQEFKLNIENNTLFYGTISGRYYAMDRNQNWDRTKLYFDALYGKSKNDFPSITDAINFFYNSNKTDEFIEPSIINGFNGIDGNKDGFLFINYRADRARQIISAIGNPKFNDFDKNKIKPIKNLLSFASYSKESDKYCPVLLSENKTKNTLGEVLFNNNMTQLRISETEKYNHVTYFFDSEKIVDYPGMKKILIPSPDVKTFDLKPEMSAYEITDNILKNLDNFNVIITNFANCDMVGHTGNEDAAIKAVSTVDKCIGKIYPEILKRNGVMIIIADHGNAEKMWDKELNVPYTAHTTNLVPCIIISNRNDIKLYTNGGLSDIAPTILDILKIQKPEDMTGKSLIE